MSHNLCPLVVSIKILITVCTLVHCFVICNANAKQCIGACSGFLSISSDHAWAWGFLQSLEFQRIMPLIRLAFRLTVKTEPICKCIDSYHVNTLPLAHVDLSKITYKPRKPWIIFKRRTIKFKQTHLIKAVFYLSPQYYS